MGGNGFNNRCVFGHMQSKENTNTDYATSLEQEVKKSHELKAFVADTAVLWVGIFLVYRAALTCHLHKNSRLYIFYFSNYAGINGGRRDYRDSVYKFLGRLRRKENEGGLRNKQLCRDLP